MYSMIFVQLRHADTEGTYSPRHPKRRRSGKLSLASRRPPKTNVTEKAACIGKPVDYLPVSVAEARGGSILNELVMATANDLRRGMAVNYNGDISVVLDSQHRTPGNLRAFVQATLRSIRTGKTSDVRFSSTEKLDVVPMVTRRMDFSYKDGEDYVFSDPETYETVNLNPEIVGDAKNYLVENAPVTVTFVEDKAVSIELPSSVVLKVSDAPEGVRGDSANNVQKQITLETGITVQAPLFIKTGEKIKVDTRTGKYMERA